MIPLTTRPLEREPQSELEPDRRGTILGLSLTGFHEVAYVDWGPADAGVPVLCVHGLTGRGAILIIWQPSSRARDGASYVRTSSGAGAAAGCEIPMNTRSLNIAPT